MAVNNGAQMAHLGLPVGPEQLLQYFERVNQENPAEHWRNGAELCRRWLTMLSSAETSQAEVDAFVSRLQVESAPGSGWIDLDLQFWQ